jgi:hypothetical protein
MARLVLVIVSAAVVAVSALLRDYGVAFVIGIAAGAILFLMGIARGGAVGNAKAYGRRPQDVSARIGVALAAAGIAAQALGRIPPYPPSFRIFYGICLAVGCIGAVVLAVRNR